jgi:hypothetical protein
MWVPDGKQVENDSLGKLVPTEVLFEFEEPLTFVCRDRDGNPLLAHSISAGDGLSRYLVSVVDERLIDELKAGRLDVLGALRQPRCWVVDFGARWEIAGLWAISFSKVPGRFLPKAGSMLTPELEPLFRLRLIGSGVGPGKTSAGDIKTAAQAVESGLRGLARIALDQKRQVGPVRPDIRRYSDLPYQFSRAASFEIAFGRPRDRLPGVDDEVFDEMGRLLEEGLHAVRANSDEVVRIEGLDADQTLELFEAIKALTPPTKGGIDRVEVGGGLIDGLAGSKVLTRDDRTRSMQLIKAARKAPRVEAPFRVTGVVEEADQGESSFTLRQLEPPVPPELVALSEIAFRFQDHLYDAVMDAFNSLERVTVVGERIDSTFQAHVVQVAGNADRGTSDTEVTNA